ncbi:MAG: MBL fold metallo-hydrolase [Burkholderiaceae bacterium]|jgi:ribonuclease Z
MRTVLDPHLVDPSGREPGLWIAVRDQRRALLFDLGELGALSPRTLLRSTHAVVTHPHMDHFAGFDHWLATALGRMPGMTVWGGPGFVDRLEHKLRAYTWNVVHRYPVPLVIEARSLEADGTRRAARFDSREAFARHDLPDEPAHGDVLFDEPLLRVRARIVDHEMPVLACAIEETAQVRLAADRIARMGLATGAWLQSLKAAVLAGVPDDDTLDVRWRDAAGDHARRFRVGELRPLVLDTTPGRRIGYVTDLRFTEQNLVELDALLAGVDLLYIECVFADEDRELARRRNHLTARQAGSVARRLGARQLQPFHFSPRYEGAEERLREQAFGAWQGAVEPDVPLDYTSM